VKREAIEGYKAKKII